MSRNSLLTHVVYFDQRTGAPHAVHWLKSFVSALKKVFLPFSVTNRRKRKKGKPKNKVKIRQIEAKMFIYKDLATSTQKGNMFVIPFDS